MARAFLLSGDGRMHTTQRENLPTSPANCRHSRAWEKPRTMSRKGEGGVELAQGPIKD